MSEPDLDSNRQLTVVEPTSSRKVSRAIAASIAVPAIDAEAGDAAVKRFLEWQRRRNAPTYPFTPSYWLYTGTRGHQSAS